MKTLSITPRSHLLSLFLFSLFLFSLLPRSSEAQPLRGNALNPSGRELALEIDDRGMSYLRKPARRTPSGFLYAPPPRSPQYQELGDGWLWRGSAELGYLGSYGDTSVARFERFADLQDGSSPANGFLFGDLALSLRRPESAFYVDFHGGSLGRDDQYYRGELGVYGQLRLVATYDGVPHRYFNDSIDIFEGRGSERLTLPAPLTPGASTEADIAQVVAATDPSKLLVQRDRAGLTFELEPAAGLRLFGSYRLDKREGTRATGGTHMFAFRSPSEGSVLDLSEPVDLRTHDVSVGLAYAWSRLHTSVAYEGSFFRNANSSLSWENPFVVWNGNPPIEEGRRALAPDNDWHNLRGELVVDLPLSSRLRALVSWGTMRQDDPLLPPTIEDGIVGPDAVDLALWNTTDALSRSTARARIDTLLVDARWRTRPVRAFDFEIRFRYYDESNRTDYTAFNPSTGELGYIAEDAGPGSRLPGQLGIYDPADPTSNWHYRAIPFGRTDTRVSGQATWRPGWKSSLGFSYEYQHLVRDHRERVRTSEGRGGITFDTRALHFATLRLSYQYAHRWGSDYHYDPYRPFYTSSLPRPPGVTSETRPRTLAQLRKPDLASRVQNLFEGRLGIPVFEAVDLAFAGGYRDDDFNAAFGLRDQETADASVELSYQPHPTLSTYLFGSFERRLRRMGTVRGTFASSGDPNFGGPVYPDSRRWDSDSDAVSHGLGAGFHWRFFDALLSSEGRSGWRLFGRMTLEADWVFSQTRETIDYEYAGPGALASPGTAGEAGSGLPTLFSRDHVVTSSLKMDWSEHIGARLYYRYAHSSIEDFSQSDLVPLSEHRLFFANVERDYSVHVVGVTLRLRY
ncbi:MAG: MtrB/PioB family outer membrane beta-barrel protein [Deltaproteobacteria bacterium]|nr:MtrB/PioB family outer membrane beta-barrel protein [Deltaproteobacteria bacterium]